MNDIKVKIENGVLTLTVELNNPPVVSKTGKSYLLASSEGFFKPGVQVDGKEVMIGFNAIIKKEKG